ncbi:MAG: carboxymuconolactone decarboxylase family protein [Acidimicrobiia bacterium]|nr:carboxymuconolactone decarboxylase family protein [Acidimicrobiia bacterium]
MQAPDAPRIEPLPPREWSPEMRDALAVLLPEHPRHPRPKREGGPKGLNALGMFAHHPALTRAFNTFNGHILFMTSLSPRQRELVVLRVAHRRDAEYEWTQHVLMAGDAGITDEEVERIAAGPGDSAWSLPDQALLRATDELLDDALITDATWEVLAEELDTEQLIDLVFTVGAYDLVAMAFRTFGVQLDEDLRK